jgi:hypothetical protein
MLPLLLSLFLAGTRWHEVEAFSAQPCAAGVVEQQWELSNGVTPGDSHLTNVKMASAKGGCWEITGCDTKDGASVGCGYGCKALPASCKSPCDCNGAWNTNSNGTITSVMDVSTTPPVLLSVPQRPGASLTVRCGFVLLSGPHRASACRSVIPRSSTWPPVLASQTNSSRSKRAARATLCARGSCAFRAQRPQRRRRLHARSSRTRRLVLARLISMGNRAASGIPPRHTASCRRRRRHRSHVMRSKCTRTAAGPTARCCPTGATASGLTASAVLLRRQRHCLHARQTTAVRTMA